MPDLLAAGRRVAQIAADLDISYQTIYMWRRQDLIDTGQMPARPAPTMPTRVRAGDPPPHRGATQGHQRPKRRYEAIAVMASEGLPVQLGCRVLEVSESGYYDVLDVHSRRVVGWSIDLSQTAPLATGVLGMAISNRSPLPSGTVIHSDHGVQCTSRA